MGNITSNRYWLIKLCALAALGIFLCGTPVRAQTWTGNSNGLWNVGSNWSSNPTIPTSSIDTVLNFGAAGVGGTALTQNIANPFLLNALNFNTTSSAYTIAGNALDFRFSGIAAGPAINYNTNNNVTLTTPLVLTAPAAVFGSGGGTLSLNGAISGGNGITINTIATVVLGSASNTYTGFTTVSGFGPLVLGTGSAIPTGRDVRVFGPGVFSTGGLSNTAATAIGTLSLSDGTFKMPSGSGNYFLTSLVSSGNNSNIDLTGSASATLHFVNAAAITISGSPDWIGAGTSRIVNDTAAPLNVNLSIFSNLNSSARLANGSSGQGFRFAGAQGSVTFTNTGNTANFIVDDQANLAVADMAFLGSGSLTLANTTAQPLPGVLKYIGASSTSSKPITLGVGGGGIWVNNTGTNLTLTGAITESFAGTKLMVAGDQGSIPGATLTLSVNNTYSGGVAIGAGAVLSVPTITNGGVAGPLGTASTAAANILIGGAPVSGSGTLRYTGPTASTNRGATLGVTAINGSGIEITDPAANLTISGPIVGIGLLTKKGPGTLTLTSATNTYGGGTFITEGRLAVGAGASLPVGGDITVASGAELTNNGINNAIGSAIGTLLFNGGSMRAPVSSGNLFLNTIETDTSGSNIDYTGSGTSLLRLSGAGAGVTIRGNSTWTGNGTSGGTRLTNETAGSIDLTVSPGVTWTNGISLFSGPMRLTGGGTLFQTTGSNSAIVTVEGATYRVDNTGNLPTNLLTFNGGTLEFSGTSATSSRSITLGNNGINFDISNPGATLTYSGVVTGNGPLIKSGPGTMLLNDVGNTYLGGFTVADGRLDVPSDAALGFASITVNGPGTLHYSSSSTTSRFFNLQGGSIEVAPFNVLTLDGATVGGGFLRRGGNITIQGGTILAGTTNAVGTSINQAGPATVTNFTNSGSIGNAAGQILTWNGGTSTTSGSLSIAGTVNASGMVNDGLLAIQTGGVLNNSNTALYLGAGSLTFVGTPATPGGTVNMGGMALELRGGLLSNNGAISNGIVNIRYGSLAKGAGTYPSVFVDDGGKFSPGNSPGTVTTGATTWGAGGGYLFEINDAAGVAGTNWDLWNINGGLSITSGTTTNSKFTISVASLDASNASGNAANFSSASNYSWLIASTTTGITGFDTARFAIDTSAFTNPTGGGTFALSQVGNNLFLNFNGVSTPPQWNVDASGSWATAANWLPPSVPNGPTTVANFLGKITAARTVTLDGDKQVQQIIFDNGNTYTIAPGSGGTLTVGDGTTGGITVTSGSHVISAPIAFFGNLAKSGPGTLTITGAQNHSPGAALLARDGQLNLNSDAGTSATAGSAAAARLALTVNNSGRVALGADQDLRSLDVTTADAGAQQLNLNSPAAAGSFRSVHVYAADLAGAKTSIWAAMRNALAPGAPDPTDGIFDSSRGLHANSGIGLALVNDVHGDPNVFIRLTRIGDLNLDGQVTISDFIDLASHFNSPGTWQEGDLNYDGQVTISDFIDLASNFNSSYAGETWPINAADQQALSAFAASVPEPGLTFAVFALSTAGVAVRRRVRSRR